eukprot:COSAG01_NODE_17_length_39991_cov_30.596160_35_plen_90_part_00
MVTTNAFGKFCDELSSEFGEDGGTSTSSPNRCQEGTETIYSCRAAAAARSQSPVQQHIRGFKKLVRQISPVSSKFLSGLRAEKRWAWIV